MLHLKLYIFSHSYIFVIKQEGKLSTADQQEIVNKHNALRRQVAKGLETQGRPGPQPSATNMREMVWDADLARAAQILTNRCNFGHDTSIPAGKSTHLKQSNHDFIL